MSELPSANLPAAPRELLLTAQVPPSAVFFDTNAALGPTVRVAVKQGRAALISSLVYAELTRKNSSPKGLEALDDSLIQRGLRVVPFDVRAARCFFDLCRQQRFDSSPLCREKENARQCFDRLRFDLIVFAAALAWRALLVTDNHRDFSLFPFGSYWSTSDAFLRQPDQEP